MAIFPSIFPALPEYPGPFQVGSIEVEFPLSEPKKFDVIDANVETVLVRFFYPADTSRLGQKAISPSWLPQPGLEYAKGYANFLKQPILPASLVISLAVYNTKIPVAENAPPMNPANSRLPVMIFSHGLGGSRSAYSQWCGSLASYGVFIAAVEHRDGSAPISIVRAGSKEQSIVPYRRITEYNDQTKHYRTAQLAQRTFEVSKLVSFIRDINHGKIFNISDEKRSILEKFKGILNTKKGQLIMGGHSFGAATAVTVCNDTENVETDYPLKDEFRAAVMLDIWMLVCPSLYFDLSNPQPLSAIPTSKLSVPSLHIISEQFLKWSENYQALPQLLRESRRSSSFAKLFYIKGSAHLSQSDFQLLFPTICRRYFNAKADAGEIMDANVRAGIEFLRILGVEGIKAEKDTIFEDDIDLWVELEKDIWSERQLLAEILNVYYWH